MTGLPDRGYESEATLGHHMKVALSDFEARGEIIDYHHVPNEGKRKYEERRNQARQGLRRGVSDYQIKLDLRLYVVATLAIELKTIKGELSDEQFHYLRKVHRPEAGHYAVVIAEKTGAECVEKLKVVLDSLKRKEAPQGF